MLKRILLAVSLLFLSLQSAGYAASGMIREMMESGIPAARRVLSTVRPLASLFTFQPSVPVVPSSTHVVKRYFSKAALLYSSVEVMDKREGLRGAFSSSVVSNIPNKMTEDKMTDEEFFVLPAHEAVEVFLKNCSTEVAEVDEGLAYIGEKICHVLLGLRSLTDCLEIEYPRDLDSFVTSWGWRLDELIKSKKDLTALRSPVSRLAKIIEDFESETKIANNYYSKMIRKRLELIN